MTIKKLLFSLSAVLCLTTPIYADYAYCKIYDAHNNKKIFHYSAVFYTTETHGATLNMIGSPFADKYNTYPGKGANCYKSSTANKALKKRKDDMQDEDRWANVVLTTWTP